MIYDWKDTEPGRCSSCKRKQQSCTCGTHYNPETDQWEKDVN